MFRPVSGKLVLSGVAGLPETRLAAAPGPLLVASSLFGRALFLASHGLQVCPVTRARGLSPREWPPLRFSASLSEENLKKAISPGEHTLAPTTEARPNKLAATNITWGMWSIFTGGGRLCDVDPLRARADLIRCLVPGGGDVYHGGGRTGRCGICEAT